MILVLAALAAAVFFAVRGDDRALGAARPASWQGLVGDAHPAVSTEQRAIVVLKTPSVAERLAEQALRDRGRRAPLVGAGARRAAAGADAARRARARRAARLQLLARAQRLLGRARLARGRGAQRRARGGGRLPGARRVPGVRLVAGARAARRRVDPGRDAAGLRRARRSRSRCSTPASTASSPTSAAASSRGSTSSTATAAADAQANPEEPTAVERHGTQMAGLLVGSGGPDGLQGVAPGATVFPIRVAGWQPDAEGRSVVYARTDQLIAGLDRAVDPDGDGDAHDAARIALIGLAEPFASFADSPESRAVEGALALDTLVVAPAGNDGAAGPLYGSLAGPGAARRARSRSARRTSADDRVGPRRHAPRARRRARRGAAAARLRALDAARTTWRRASARRGHGHGRLVRRARAEHRRRPRRARRRRARTRAPPRSRPPARAQPRCSSTARACRRARSASPTRSPCRSSPCRRRRADAAAGAARRLRHRRRRRPRALGAEQPHEPRRAVLVARPLLRRRREARPDRAGHGARARPIRARRPTARPLRERERHERRRRHRRRHRRAARPGASRSRRAPTCAACSSATPARRPARR